MSLPPAVPTPVIYLMFGILPVVAERDLQIMRLVSQLSMCSREIQTVSDIIEDHLIKYDIHFPGWSGMARRTAAIYSLEDPLEIMREPWKTDRFASHAKQEITKYWLSLLHDNVESRDEPYSTIDLLDISRLDLKTPHPIFEAAGSNTISTQRATVVVWFLLGVYNTQERLYKMKKTRSPLCCLCSSASVENRSHMILSCDAYREIRKTYIDKFLLQCPALENHMDISDQFLTTILDPFSPRVHPEIREGWLDSKVVYGISRDFIYGIHKKREKLMGTVTLHDNDVEAIDNIIITLYSKQLYLLEFL